MIMLRVQLRVAPAIRDRAAKSLVRLIGPTRAARECTHCSTYADVEDPNSLLYVEEWATQDAIEARLRAADLRVLLSVLDLACEPPTIRLDTINETRGLEAIAMARAGGERPADTGQRSEF
jgi:quinol monooxygenase YgiN